LMFLLCVSFGALPEAAVFAGSSTGEGGWLSVAAGCEVVLELVLLEACVDVGDVCEEVLSWASAGTALAISSTAITAARACDFMGKLQCRNAEPQRLILGSLYAWNPNVGLWISATLNKLQRFCNAGSTLPRGSRPGTAGTGLE
jgi:hypothetical protein